MVGAFASAETKIGVKIVIFGGVLTCVVFYQRLPKIRPDEVIRCIFDSFDVGERDHRVLFGEDGGLR